MAFSFTIEDEAAEIQAGFETVGADAPAAEEPAADSVEGMLSEAERRFAKAKYYEVLIRDPIFVGDTSPVGQEVFQEVQVFARERLSALLGLKAAASAPPPSVFSAEEIDVLKKLVAKLLKKPELASTPQSPTLRKLQAPQEPQGPALRRVQSPSSQPAQAPAKPQPKATKPAAKKPEAKKAQDTGEIFKMPQKDGTFRTYRKVKEGDQDVYIGENNQRYLMTTNNAGEYYMKSLNRQARPTSGPQPLPPLSELAIATVAARHAQAALDGGTINVTGAALDRGRPAEGGGISISALTH